MHKQDQLRGADQNGPDEDLSWEELAQRSQTGNRRAYTKLLNKVAVYTKKRLICGLANPDWVEEVVQDVLISVHKSFSSYSPDRPFKPWLSSIIHFRKADFLRKHYKAREVNRASQDVADIFEHHVTDNPHIGELKDMDGALASLPAKQRNVFKRMRIEGYSAAEVAREMKMSVSAVKVSAHRAAKRLQDSLKVDA
ncbi:MAG: RNA polymerase sigma factor [Alphaproteobacteria bacterium]